MKALILCLVSSVSLAQTVNIPVQVSVTPTTVTVAVGASTTVIPVPPPVVTPPTGLCSANAITLNAGIPTTAWANNWNYGQLAEVTHVLYNGLYAAQFTANASGGGGGWLPYALAPAYFNTAGCNWYQITIAPTRAGQSWQLVMPDVPNTPTATDHPVPGALSVVLEKYGPAPSVGVYATYKVPLHCGLIANDCGVNLPAAGVVIMKQGVQDQINANGKNPALGHGNVWYVADARYIQ